MAWRKCAQPRVETRGRILKKPAQQNNDRKDAKIALFRSQFIIQENEGNCV